MKNAINERDFYLDTVKGLLVLGIVFIHTVFWSGESYVPKYMRNIALTFDVPLFFFVTGCVMSIYKNLNPLKQILKLAMIFFFGVLIFQLLFLHIDLANLIKPLFLSRVNIPQFKAVSGSYWFVPVYVVALIFAKIILDYFKDIYRKLILVFIPVYYIVLWFGSGYIGYIDILTFGINLQQILFYIWLILFGHEYFYTKGKNTWLYLFFMSVLFILTLFYFYPNIYFQNLKSPVQLPYFVLSLISVSVAMYLYRPLKNNIFAKIGKNAIYYYFSQGIGASLICYIAKLPIQIWQIKFIICLGVNIIISLLLGYIISLIYPKFERLLLK